MKNIKLLCLLGLLLTTVLLNAQDEIKVALMLSDSYYLLGEESARAAETSLVEHDYKARVECYYYSELESLNADLLDAYQIIYVDVVNLKKVEGILPVLNKLGELGTEIVLVGGNNQSIKQYSYLQTNAKSSEFFEQSGKMNLSSMILDRCKYSLGLKLPDQKIIFIPEYGLCNLKSHRIFSNFEAYKANYQSYEEGNPWVALNIWRSDFLSEQHQHIISHIKIIEEYGFNVLCYYGHPTMDSLSRYFFDSNNNLVPEIILAQSAWLGVNPMANQSVYKNLGVPVINLIQINQSSTEWVNGEVGVRLYKRTNHLSIPEQMGMIQPIITGSKETLGETGQGKQKVAIDFQLKKMIKRLQQMHVLQQKPNNEKKVVLIYYSHPPGKELLGASYLNVVPNSLHSILERMQVEGYHLSESNISKEKIFEDVTSHGINIGNWAPAEIEKLVAKGEAILVPLALYEQWYAKLSSNLKAEIEKQWGAPKDAKIMTWENRRKEKFFVLPAVSYGKVLLAPQPVRAWSQDVDVMHHDVTLPPHHQYLAFYLYLQHSFNADALVHLGTHSTLEWLPGKETGLNNDDASEALLGNMVNIYPYIVDDVGEGLQAKRRANAIIIDHLTPPFDKLDVNPELKKIETLISEHEIAEGKSVVLARAKFNEIYTLSKQHGLLDDLGLDTIINDAQLHFLEHYIEEVREQNTPLGLHTFGQLPSAENITSSVNAIVANKTDLTTRELEVYKAEIRSRIIASAQAELEALVDALDGKYIEASTGNDPIRNPAAIPTGKNFYAFDASYLPSPEVYKQGAKLAATLIQEYKEKHDGEFPDKLTFNLWSTECIRNEGIMEAQIMNLLGVKPVYDGYGKVSDIAIIPRNKLGRPRIDVLMIPSGLYRDIFPQLMLLLDKSVRLANKQKEVDNYVRNNSLKNYQELKSMALPDSLAKSLSLTRMFSTPVGAYGTGTNTVIDASGTWEQESEVAAVFLNRMHFPYSNDFWGQKVLADSLLEQLFSMNLSGTKAVLHSRTSNLYATLDNDDFFQYLGGTALAIRSIDGDTPDVIVSNLSNSGNLRQESLEYFISREMQARYLNPEWIDNMLSEGYSGARFIRQVGSNLWGWQVTVPDAVDESKWENFYDTYVEDKYDLDIKKKFEESGNLYAYQVLTSRMMEVIRKGYWDAEDEIREQLLTDFLETVKTVGLSCNSNVCNNNDLSTFMEEEIERIGGIPKSDVKAYKKAMKVIKKKSLFPSDASEQQIAKNNNKSRAYLPSKKVKGYKVEQIKSNEVQKGNSIEFNYKWILLLLLTGYTIYFLLKKRTRKNSKNI